MVRLVMISHCVSSRVHVNICTIGEGCIGSISDSGIVNFVS